MASCTLVAELIAAPVFDRLHHHSPILANKVRATVRWLGEIAEPPSGLELASEDGSTYSGLVLIERSRPVLMLAVRHPPERRSASNVTPLPYRDEDRLPNW